ncbi:DUF4381 domain-containing protein [Flammeovirga agarivorans]|uniref:DUF4381 domain-containing protein n=1 Tax=Flammeovirga agarivorans TaxID=2726742 RepID=A0A7X8SMQ9_9BACT|nr:DUF4381 domain-containing protein [Flammeovirga agarivorans]NLR93023.1 DUF4381 domain-containing protein [Flammeovirga agarivorans]
MILQDTTNWPTDSLRLANEVLDFIPPEKVDMTPSAPGWYIVGGIFLLIMLVGVVKMYFNYLGNAYKRTAIQQINTINPQSQSLNEGVYQINTILKRVALTTYERENVAQLSGQDWINFLNDHSNIKFNQNDQDLLLNAAYMKDDSIREGQLTSLANTAIKWIKNHV